MGVDSALEARWIRHRRLRRRIIGRPDRPRLSVFRGNQNMFVQIINDHEGRTLFSESTLSKRFRKEMKTGGTVQAALVLGRMVGEAAVKKGIERVVFDRGGLPYHGRIKALADGAREKGLKF
ncbi:MAG: 50S ribosomal protein L18 [Candidatus Omnitrophica bacterium]|nr:50S ribosomal protein L18 [Candidatus Omnitrophota bacterium]